MKGGVVAAQTATIQAAYVAESGATLVEFATPEETVAAVRSGEADAVLADFAYLKPIVDASGGELTIVDDSVSIGGGVGMGIRESDGELKAKMDAAIASMKADGTLCAVLTLNGAWMDTVKRKLTLPPEAIENGLDVLPRSEDFEWIATSKSPK